MSNLMKYSISEALEVSDTPTKEWESLRELYTLLGLDETSFPRWVRRNLIGTDTNPTGYIEGVHYKLNPNYATGISGKKALDYLVRKLVVSELAITAKTEAAKSYRAKVLNENIIYQELLKENVYSLQATNSVLTLQRDTLETKAIVLEQELSRLNVSAVKLKDMYKVSQYRIGRNALYNIMRDAGLLNKSNEPTSLAIKSNYLTQVGKEVFITNDGLSYAYELLADKEKQVLEAPSVEDIRSILDSAVEVLEFDEPSHKYSVEGKTLKSVSHKLYDYVNEFPANLIAPKVAAKRNREEGNVYGSKEYLSTQDILNEWDYKRDFAANYGSMVHYEIEKLIAEKYLPGKEVKDLTIDYTIFGDKLDEITQKVKNKGQLLLAYVEGLIVDGHQIVDTEVKMFNRQLGIAGTMDLLTLKDNKLYCHDWKSNDKDIENDHYNQNMNAPFNTLKASTLNKYALQLSYYQLLLNRIVPIEVADRVVVQVRDTVVTFNTTDYTSLLQ